MNVQLTLGRARAGAGDGPHAPRFRVVSIDGKRRGFRLESIFWSALELIASHHGRTLPAQIASILQGVDDDANASAAVRSSVAAELIDISEIGKASAVNPSWEKVLTAMPHPAFALTRNQAIVALNDPMWAFLESRGLPRAPAAPNEVLGVELTAAALARRHGVDPGDFVLCNAVFRVGGRLTNCRVRIIQAAGDAGDRRLMLGFPDAI
jgi:predicted DNA-binding ribbon-helix-helix protein